MRSDDGSTKPSSHPPRATNGASPSPLRKSGTSNGVHSPSNGTSTTNGNSVTYTNGDRRTSHTAIAPTFYGHDREAVARILIQGLQDLGYQSAATALSRESKFELESPHVSAFKLAILSGDWTEAEALLSEPALDHGRIQGSPSRSSNGNGHDGSPLDHEASLHTRKSALALGVDANRSEMLFMIRQQKYLELLEQRDIPSALLVLRQELHPLHQEQRQLHALSSLIMCRSSEDLKSQARWDGAQGESRKSLLSTLSHAISPSVMIPEHRLATLFDQVKEYQALECQYHNSSLPPSLYLDHTCSRDGFPLELHAELDQHLDEVWFVAFSNNGKMLATASKDNSVIIYDTSTFHTRHVLKEHRMSVAYVAWSPNDERLVSCSQDHEARLWDTATGRCVRRLKHHDDHVTTAAWAPDGQSFVTGSTDLRRPLSIWSLDNHLSETSPLFTFENSCNRVLDCAVAALVPPSSTLFSESKEPPDPNRPPTTQIRLAAICADRTVHVYDYMRREKLRHINFDHRLTSISLSTDGREMLINLESSEIWTLGVEDGEMRRKYRGLRQGKYVIRSCFGGATEGFVVSGDEDGAICVWHRHSGQLIEKIDGHKIDDEHPACVNAVAWNTANPKMFASASDDSRVRIWAAAHPHMTQAQLLEDSRRQQPTFANDGLGGTSVPRWGTGGSLMQRKQKPSSLGPIPNGRGGRDPTDGHGPAMYESHEQRRGDLENQDPVPDVDSLPGLVGRHLSQDSETAAVLLHDRPPSFALDMSRPAIGNGDGGGGAQSSSARPSGTGDIEMTGTEEVIIGIPWNARGAEMLRRRPSQPDARTSSQSPQLGVAATSVGAGSGSALQADVGSDSTHHFPEARTRNLNDDNDDPSRTVGARVEAMLFEAARIRREEEEFQSINNAAEVQPPSDDNNVSDEFAQSVLERLIMRYGTGPRGSGFRQAIRRDMQRAPSAPASHSAFHRAMTATLPLLNAVSLPSERDSQSTPESSSRVGDAGGSNTTEARRVSPLQSTPQTTERRATSPVLPATPGPWPIPSSQGTTNSALRDTVFAAFDRERSRAFAYTATAAAHHRSMGREAEALAEEQSLLTFDEEVMSGWTPSDPRFSHLRIEDF